MAEDDEEKSRSLSGNNDRSKIFKEKINKKKIKNE